MLLALILSVYAPDPMRLGADDYQDREAAHARYDNALSALMLPDRHENPEVAHRIRAIKTRNLKELDAVYLERRLHRDDYSAWVKRHVIDSDSKAFDLHEVWYELHANYQLASLYFQSTGEQQTQPWLTGFIADGEWDQWRAHVQWHRSRAITYPAVIIAQSTK